MDERPTKPTTATTFVVRFWREWSAGEPRWRGQIEHVSSGQAANFFGTAGLVAFLWQFGICCDSDPQKLPDDYRLD
jgi:hypothetical protein